MYRVLLVDDEPYIRQGLRVLIDWDKYGFMIVDEAENGIKALELIENNRYDVMLLDIKMPKMSGVEVAMAVRERGYVNLKIIILSGYFEYEFVKKALEYRVNTYLLKPVQPEELVESLKLARIEIEKERRATEVSTHVNKIVSEYYIKALVLNKLTNKMRAELRAAFKNCHMFQYLYVEFDSKDAKFAALSEKQKNRELYKLKEELQHKYESFANYIICNSVEVIETYDLGILVTDNTYENLGMSEEQFTEEIVSYLSSYHSFPLTICKGDKVRILDDVYKSYQSALYYRKGKPFAVSNQLLLQIEEDVKENYMNDISLKSLSEKYYVNTAYLGQLFKREYGVYFKDYLNSIRIKQAAILLKQTENKIYEIAKAVGYNNTDHFINTFTKEMGVTPHKYRKRKK